MCIYFQSSPPPIALAKFSPREPDVIVYVGYNLDSCCCLQFYSLSQHKASDELPALFGCAALVAFHVAHDVPHLHLVTIALFQYFHVCLAIFCHKTNVSSSIRI